MSQVPEVLASGERDTSIATITRVAVESSVANETGRHVVQSTAHRRGASSAYIDWERKGSLS